MDIYWEKTKYNGARIIRMFGNLPTVVVPPQISGYPVTEIGSYCFSKTSRLPEHYLTLAATQSAASRELCGSYIESVDLPDSVTILGDYAFYDCRNLSKIVFGKNLHTVGSDAFMNCQHLNRLQIRGKAGDTTGLRRILGQIFWNVEVSFLAFQQQHLPEAVVFYPEFQEAYDEIAPAHIFGRKIIGEGFRARQSFQNDVIDFFQYDQIFEKACAEEPVLPMCHLAFCRLCYPYSLADSKKSQYESYIRAHGKPFCRQMILEKKLDVLSFLFRTKLVLENDIPQILAFAAQAGWSEGAASLLRWKSANYPAKSQPKYDFEDF